VLQLGRRPLHDQPLQEVSPIEAERLRVAAGGDRLLEGDRVAPQEVEVHPELFVSPSEQHLLPQGTPQEVQGLTEGVAGVLLVEIRPEEHEQASYAGGVYLFEDELSRDAFLAGELAATVKSAPFHQGLDVKLFDVMPEGIAVTRGPVESAPVVRLAPA
jgi:hypothetical protein